MAAVTLSEVAQTLCDRIESGSTVVGFTGAGISKASGVPTFRGEEGLWERHRPEDVAHINVLRRDPATFWRFHDNIRSVLTGAVPNCAHFVLAEMEEVIGPESDFAVITQNIDHLHQRAGNHHVVALHGDALSYSCMDCEAVIDDVPLPSPRYPPLCDDCGGVIRPDVVLFGEILPLQALSEARQLCEEADVLLVVGTSGIVEPAASLPYVALHNGALIVEINPERTPLTGHAHYSIQATATAALPALWERMDGKLRRRK